MDLQQQLLTSAAGKEWAKVGVSPHHGVNIPLFSLHCQDSLGIGEYLDLIPLIDWSQQVGLDVIQLLPLNDTGIDTSPYSALSANALNPIYLKLSALPHFHESDSLKALWQETHAAVRWTQRIDYPSVYSAKRHFLQIYYDQVGPSIVADQNYQQFLSQHRHWLEPYALFKVLKEKYQWRCWEQWEEANPTQEQFQELSERHAAQMAFHIVLQYLCFMQMRRVKEYGDRKKVLIKGDIPILINRESADVWFYRNLFEMNCSAGAPPDMYSAVGQNWGFPCYQWSSHIQDNYAWWRQRLSIASALYRLYRIDHIVGFFRIWSIPSGCLGNQGAYVPQDFSGGMSQGAQIMRMMLDSTEMLPIGEDLGNVPNEVRALIRELGICGTKVMRWERKWQEDRRFIPYEEYIPESMTTVSTHDSETLQQWWQNNPQEAKDFSAFKGWEYTPELTIEMHREILYDSHHTGSLFHINLLQEYLALIPGMTWPDPQDERINVPGMISDRNWSYRFRNPVEEIVSSASLQQLLRGMLCCR